MPISQATPRRHPPSGSRSSLLLWAIVALGALAAPAVAPVAAEAQLRPSQPLQGAYFAWDEGRYVEAMEGYLRVLEGPDGARFAGEVARLTGEVHPVRELEEDGRGLRVSPDGSYLAWTREVDGEWSIRVEPTAGGARVELPGRLVALSAAESAAYLADDGLRIRELSSGAEERVALPGLRPVDLTFDPSGAELFLTAGREGEGDRLRVYRLRAPEWSPVPLELGGGHQADPHPVPGRDLLVFSRPDRSPLPVPEGMSPTDPGEPGIGVVDLASGRVLDLPGGAPTLAAGGSRLAWLQPTGQGATRIMALELPATGLPDGEGTMLLEADRPVGFPALSPDGSRVAFQAQPHWSWEIFLVPADGSGGEVQVTREAQHDQFPAWVSNELLVSLKGESRHRRSYLHHLESGESYRLFHNNTLRTIAPEYEWVPDPAGRGVFIAAQRDGNTISPERGVFWVDLTRTVTHAEVTARVHESLEAETALLAQGREAFAPVADQVRAVSGEVSAGRVFHYASALYAFGSKFITQPGNLPAVEYLRDTLESWGYEVELQWFEARGVRTPNVVATLPGTRNPELVYVISSHFDSVLPSPGADDNSSGTTALLEAARVLADHPRAATIQFAFLTGEEAGLLGAREFVRRAIEDGKQVAGVLNNDMIGWTRSHRLDNTIRYSNPGIKDIQHAASHFFSDLITYDALYYRGTDAAVFYDAYGDVVGGIGSYPVLGNPHYHRATDQLETINHRLVAEVSRTTVATIMLLADSPARLTGVTVAARPAGGYEATWDPAPEVGVEGYEVRYRGGDGAWVVLPVTDAPRAELPPGAVGVEVRAVRDNATRGWDWAR